MPARDTLPVIVLAGFLGSGKTTVLNSLLHARDGRRIGVIVNDFGDIPIDGWLVDASVDTSITLGGGCLCCVTGAGGVDDMIARLADPALALDAIVIEASGVADPANLARRVSHTRVPRARFAGVVLVIDAVEHLRTLQRHPRLAQDGLVADLIVLNKVDLVASDAADALVRRLRDTSGGAPVVRTEHGRLDPDLLFDAAPPRPRAAGPTLFDALDEGAGAAGMTATGPGDVAAAASSTDTADVASAAGAVDHDHDHDHDHDQCGPGAGHLHDLYGSVSFQTDTPLSPTRFLALLHEHPQGLYRLKGYVRMVVSRGPGASRHALEVHSVGAHVTFARQHARRGRPSIDDTRLVLIGVDLDRDDLDRRLRACETSAPLPGDRAAMVTVNRYLS